MKKRLGDYIPARLRGSTGGPSWTRISEDTGRQRRRDIVRKGEREPGEQDKAKRLHCDRRQVQETVTATLRW